jgi:DNA primase
LNAKGHEIFYNCVVFPLYDGQGVVSGLYGRNIGTDAVAHLYLAGPRTGIVNRQAVKRSQTIFLTESIIDALTLYDQGFKNVIPLYGVKAQAEGKTGAPFELTTIDLYSSRSRAWFAKLCAELFNADEALTREDVGKLLPLVENYKPRSQNQTAAEPTREQKRVALSFLKNPDMFAEILADLQTLGVTGEATNKLVGYLAAVSRKLDEPLSVLIQSRSAAGKSTLQDAVLSLVPDEDYVKYTRITDQALFYKDEDSLVHKILAIEEEVGMGGAAYSIRNIQSSKKITVAATGKDPGSGKMRTEEYTVKGPVAVMITTTAADLEGETASRFLFLTIDESAAMTAAIHKMQRRAETLQGLVTKKKAEHIIAKHHAAQRMLKPLAVVNPYAEYLSYPDHNIRTRRDHKKYLGLMRTIAFLHQHQRKVRSVAVEGNSVEYIEVSLDDIDAANALADQVLGQSLSELAPPSATLLAAVYEMVKAMAEKANSPVGELYFTRRMIREYTGWSDWQIRAHIKQLEDLEYLHARIGAKGKEYAYALNYRGQGQERRRFYLNLTPVDEIKKRMAKNAN